MESCDKCKTGGFEHEQLHYVWSDKGYKKKGVLKLKQICSLCFQELAINGKLEYLNTGEPGETQIVSGGEIDANPQISDESGGHAKIEEVGSMEGTGENQEGITENGEGNN